MIKLVGKTFAIMLVVVGFIELTLLLGAMLLGKSPGRQIGVVTAFASGLAVAFGLIVAAMRNRTSVYTAKTERVDQRW